MRSRALLVVILILLAGLLIYRVEKDRRKSKPAPATTAKPATAVEPTVEGSYRVEGLNPDGTPYTGTLDLQKKGEIFSAMWQAGDIKFSGVGLKEDSVLSVTYFPKAKPRAAVYKISPGKLDGRWIAYGDSLVGKEVGTKQP